MPINCFRRQDEELDELSASVQRIGGVGLTIHEELIGQVSIFAISYFLGPIFTYSWLDHTTWNLGLRILLSPSGIKTDKDILDFKKGLHFSNQCENWSVFTPKISVDVRGYLKTVTCLLTKWLSLKVGFEL